ncbi:MAG: hypothetical protein CMH48_03365 [Muricauda sp.]|uniref:Uncharacterized protein n=1 Tax=Flagellimonas lutaonensis TaxID=516051 RepID=A0A0D5YWH3_9FLAO|nr:MULTISPECIES: hypothetical protein [Allomuricauda]AKA36271.1 hypothetical protein VC82_2711 [Allomuricauda lutaonensis]MBC29861.1 hypothetical protein [Allomuricauda sp.]|tara:strand:- start:13 stop:309 length:297 start_codon:yes stop_codon:yes gene_type:complete
MVEFKRIVPILLFLALMSIKVSAFHVYAHQDNDSQIENCEFCDLAIENQQSEHTPTFTVALDFQPPVEIKESKLYGKSINFADNTYRSGLYSRPPPVI